MLVVMHTTFLIMRGAGAACSILIPIACELNVDYSIGIPRQFAINAAMSPFPQSPASRPCTKPDIPHINNTQATE
ncbi:hypothetical protein [Thiothrix subterranea]|uniref:Uncharacterized protein n=2 Tax=Thiothrix subterranea TaxID=2735563 RepID=A0AA51MTQ8_9GAMM|nr:hypothetical protein [Thiothrix subterranea]MDQ5770007.1 hypothetical protein [Thiothrix subterranea]WML88292.1 hypothetical protein RCG00_07905 [Thiothrix subterranea]